MFADVLHYEDNGLWVGDFGVAFGYVGGFFCGTVYGFCGRCRFRSGFSLGILCVDRFFGFDCGCAGCRHYDGNRAVGMCFAGSGSIERRRRHFQAHGYDHCYDGCGGDSCRPCGNAVQYGATAFFGLYRGVDFGCQRRVGACLRQVADAAEYLDLGFKVIGQLFGVGLRKKQH